ncbi:hypothetical protein H696_00577 [Fonticula alba]|uniref:Transcription factor CBF/NF-Y/archaeal histone domain-containing protein n=1 Tax=Fonticula alba TaxID=691883 RepID=A0A058ZGH3_FONAL|nr:hypothetical protein H696_00577 [Fonticula alba]KCV73028.1 hypothetical protein H696_00577 [Fonticula alba]|eukprot:XP_009492729.1 hypothetical protein H696_00577 [Fonticula alba]
MSDIDTAATLALPEPDIIPSEPGVSASPGPAETEPEPSTEDTAASTAVAVDDRAGLDAFALPALTIGRALRYRLPDNAMLSQESQLCARRAATLFINYVIFTAMELSPGRVSPSPASIVAALRDMKLDSIAASVEYALAHNFEGPGLRPAATGGSSATTAPLRENDSEDELDLDTEMGASEELMHALRPDLARFAFASEDVRMSDASGDDDDDDEHPLFETQL